MKRDPSLYLQHILDAIARTETYLHGVNEAAFLQNTLIQERINSQAVALGIERPRLRNGLSIANHNTLLYVLTNLRALRRIRQRQAGR